MEESVYSEKLNQSEMKCTRCGAKLSFSPGTTSLKCEFCGNINEIQTSTEAVREIDFRKFLSNQGNIAPKQDISTVKCDTCGAATTFEKNIVSANCAFCGANLIIDNQQTTSIIKPSSMLPFKIEEKQAKEEFAKWLKKLWFAPDALKKYARQGKITGMYIPYWTYDSNTYSKYTGERGEDYQETEEYTDDEGNTKTRTVTRTDWTSVRGDVNNSFDDILVVASKSLPQKLFDKLEPWDLQNLISYDSKFLAGFKTETYQIDLEEGFGIGKDKMEVTIRETVRRDIGGDHQRIRSLNTTYNDMTFKHILLPLWISAYRFNEKVYRFMVNARTGEVGGERPYSWIKIVMTILFVIAVIAVIYFLTQDS